jgi:Cys-rich four helix bundle protein (predicted Tat secretion target)
VGWRSSRRDKISNPTKEAAMNRREVLMGAGALALAAVAKAAPSTNAGEAHHHNAAAQGLVDASAGCLEKGEVCQQHCFGLLGSGDTSMAACASTVRDMLAATRGVFTLAAAGSKHTRTLAKACAEICKDCEAECRKHQDKHKACHDCADACARMQQEIAKLPA